MQKVGRGIAVYEVTYQIGRGSQGERAELELLDDAEKRQEFLGDAIIVTASNLKR